ncbi:hypothetical protein GCM10009602_70870 [Nocardiopsis tropica]
MKRTLRAALRLLGLRPAGYARGGILPPAPSWHRLAPDDHVLIGVHGQLHCARPTHRRHVCHGNQYDPHALTWRPR